ncbi:MAG: tetratricopeptide repeat protein [Candidatus Thiodiazotropha sp. (ex Dulcina madagascariensis)]|nr:tetratricopeptide repeat protein [Candidatus Thiodiazotropha sp. (ex Dulcina madagascariensis)]
MKRNLSFRLFACKTVLSLVFILSVIQLSACMDRGERKASYFKRGMDLYEQGNYTKARLEFKNVLQIDPKDADAYFMFGQIEERDENWPKAYALFLRATELNPDHVDAQVHLGTIYALSGETDKALSAAEIALAVEPNNASALVLKGFTKARMGEKDAAINEALAAVESDPNNVEAASLLAALYADQGSLERAIRIAKDSLALHPERVASYLLLARLYAQADREEDVVSVLSDLIRARPEDLQNRLHLASYYKGKGNIRRAEAVLRQAVADMAENTDAKLALISLLKNSDQVAIAESLLQEFSKDSPENFALRLELAKFYLNNQRKTEAFAVLSDVIRLADQTPDGLQARSLKASVLSQDGLFQEASELIDEVLAIDPKHKDALLIRAGIGLMGDDPDRGIADLRTLLKEDSGYVKAHRLKARAHLKKGEVELARQSLENAIQVQPEEATANFELVELLIQTGELDDAVVVLEKMRRFFPEDLKVLRGVALVHEKLKQWNKLAEIADVIVSKHQQSPLGYYYRGVSLQQRGRVMDSVSDFVMALERKPDSIEALVALAKSYYAMNKPDDALRRIEAVIDANPDHYQAVNLMGEVHFSQQRLQAAENAFNLAVGIRPEWPVPYRNLIKIKLLEGKKTEAIELLRRGFATTGDPILGVELANTLDRAGQVDKAVQTYQKILEKNPSHPLASNNLAMILLRGEPDQDQLDRALSLVAGFEMSENPIFLDTLGWTHIKRGDIDQAISILERAAREEPAIPDIDYHLGLAYYQQGRMDIAKRRVNAAISSGKSFDDLEAAKALIQKIPE